MEQISPMGRRQCNAWLSKECASALQAKYLLSIIYTQEKVTKVYLWCYTEIRWELKKHLG